MARDCVALQALVALRSVHDEIERHLAAVARAQAARKPVWDCYGYARWALQRANERHLQLIDQQVIPLLRANQLGGDQLFDQIAGKNLGERRPAGRRRDELVSVASPEPDEFSLLSESACQWLLRRIDLERRELYPLLEALHGRSSSCAADDR